MYGRAGLERFKKAQTLEPFEVAASSSSSVILHSENQQKQQQISSSTQVGGGQSNWQAPDWGIEPRAGVYYLDVLKDGEVIDRINLDKRRHIFGRQLHTCDFILDHQSVSRQHAALVPHKNGSVYVIDLGSAHGTFVANERLTKDSPVELEVGQSLRFAASTRVYILRKDADAYAAPPPPQLPNPPDPSDEEAVLAYNTFMNRYNNNNLSERPSKRSKKKSRVAFRDEVGGELVEVVGVSDGADVETQQPGPIPMGLKEGSSLVGKYESLVQTTLVPLPLPLHTQQSKLSPKGVTDKLQQLLNKVKHPDDDLYGDSLSSTKVASSWACSPPKLDQTTKSPSETKFDNNHTDHDDDDDLFG